MFNLNHGIDPVRMWMSVRGLGRPPLEKGANKGRRVQIEKLRHDYWESLGWDKQTGRPTAATLKRLGLEL